MSNRRNLEIGLTSDASCEDSIGAASVLYTLRIKLRCVGRVADLPLACCVALLCYPRQVHPTAFVDPKKPDQIKKTLCAELLRGVGGILIDNQGARFADELGTRAYLTGECCATEQNGGSIGSWNVYKMECCIVTGVKYVYVHYTVAGRIQEIQPSNPVVSILLNGEQGKIADKHVPHYIKKGLLTQLESLSAVAQHMKVSPSSFVGSCKTVR